MEVTEPVINDNVDTLIEGETNKTSDAEPNNLVITNTVELKVSCVYISTGIINKILHFILI